MQRLAKAGDLLRIRSRGGWQLGQEGGAFRRLQPALDCMADRDLAVGTINEGFALPSPCSPIPISKLPSR